MGKPLTDISGAKDSQESTTYICANESWYTLVNFQELPHWQQDNHYIHTGYRQASYSYWRSIQSTLQWHNETVNIWTHLLPGVLSIPFATKLYSSLSSRYKYADSSDIWAMACFFFGAGTGLILSGSYHTVCNHSPSISKFWNQLDYAGIAIMIWGSFVPSVYYGFWCDPKLVKLYWSMITIVGLACITASLLSKFRTPAWRPYRALLFVSMGLCAVFPVIHSLRMYGLQQMRSQIGLFWLVLQGLLYIIGAGLYAFRFPESEWPGKFDKIGSSHQIFHVFVVLAAASHLRGLLVAFDHRHGLALSKC